MPDLSSPPQSQNVPPVNPPSSSPRLGLVVVVVLLLLLILGGGFLLVKSKKTTDTSKKNATPTTASSGASTKADISASPTVSIIYAKGDYKAISIDKKSPKGNYEVKEDIDSNGNIVTVIYTGGKISTANLVKQNEDTIGFGTKIACQCQAKFSGWVDDNSFILKIVNVNKEVFEYRVDAKTGLVDKDSLRKAS